MDRYGLLVPNPELGYATSRHLYSYVSHLKTERLARSGMVLGSFLYNARIHLLFGLNIYVFLRAKVLERVCLFRWYCESGVYVCAACRTGDVPSRTA